MAQTFIANESDSGQPMPETHNTTILCTTFRGITEASHCNLKKWHGTILLSKIGISPQVNTPIDIFLLISNMYDADIKPV